METTITLSRTSAIIKCCIVAGLIALVFSFAGSISIKDFFTNLLDWQSI